LRFGFPATTAVRDRLDQQQVEHGSGEEKLDDGEGRGPGRSPESQALADSYLPFLGRELPTVGRWSANSIGMPCRAKNAAFV
jgi:hypothetical protein